MPEGASPQNTYAGVSAAYHAAHMVRESGAGGDSSVACVLRFGVVRARAELGD